MKGAPRREAGADVIERDGLSLFLGGEKSFNQAVVQVAGGALRMNAGPFKDAFTLSHALTDLLHLHTQAQLTQTSQTTPVSAPMRR